MKTYKALLVTPYLSLDAIEDIMGNPENGLCDYLLLVEHGMTFLEFEAEEPHAKMKELNEKLIKHLSGVTFTVQEDEQ